MINGKATIADVVPAVDVQNETNVTLLEQYKAALDPAKDQATMAMVDARIATLKAGPIPTLPTKEQWKPAEVVGAFEGKISFIAPATANTSYRKVAINTTEEVADAIEALYDEADAAGEAFKREIYGVKRMGRNRVNISIHKDLLKDAKTGYSIIVPVEMSIKDVTTYWNKKENRAEFHKTTGLSTAAPTITSGESQLDLEQEERDLEIISGAADAGFATALATYLGSKRRK